MTLAFSLAGLAVLAMLALSRPWWWPHIASGPLRRRANVAAYHSRLAEISRDHAAGLLHTEESDALKAEVGAQLLIDAPRTDVPERAGFPRWIGLCLVLMAPMLAAVGYWQLGSWKLQQQISSAAADLPPPEVAAMVENLAARLKTDPGDPKAWALLGRSYFVMRRYADSAQAYHEANARNGGSDASTLTDEGESIAFANGSQVPDTGTALFDRALLIAPDDPKALWYGGLADAQAGRLDRARERWSRLQSQPLPEQMKDLLARGLEQLNSAQTTASAQPGASAESVDPGAKPGAPVSLRLKISVSPKLAAQLPASATLFVYAKADGGPHVPLAVVRQPVAGWPVNVVLDDSMAMAPTLHLSAFPRYIVTARISRSNEAQEQAGDLEGVIHVDRADAAHAPEIVIDRVLP